MQFMEWNYKNRTSFANGDCGKIKGSSSELFPRPVVQDKIVFFLTDVCRYVTMEYVGDVEIFSIKARKYKLGAAFLDNGSNFILFP